MYERRIKKLQLCFKKQGTNNMKIFLEKTTKLLSSLESLNSPQSQKSLENVIYPMMPQPLKPQILRRVNNDPLGPSNKFPKEERTFKRALVGNQPAPAAGSEAEPL